MKFFERFIRREKNAEETVAPLLEQAAPVEAVAEAVTKSPSEVALESRQVRSSRELGGGTNKTKIVELKDDGKAVAKPASGEREVAGERGHGYKRERAAYLVDLILGLGLVPPTVIRNIDNEIGSLQEYIQRSRVGIEVSAKERKNLAAQMSKMTLFDYIIANKDRHTGNWLVDENAKVWAIDHGITFEKDDNSPPEGILGLEIDPQTIASIVSAAKSGTKKNVLKRLLLELLDEEEVDSCLKRLERLAVVLEKMIK